MSRNVYQGSYGGGTYRAYGGVVSEVVPTGAALARARELAAVYLRANEITGRNTRINFIQPSRKESFAKSATV